jgi:dynein heavy chain
MHEDFAAKKKVKIDLILFDYVIEHLVRILRIIKTPRENSLLIGIGGSVKKSFATVLHFTLYMKFLKLHSLEHITKTTFGRI